MTQTTSRLFDDFAKLLTNAAGTANSVREEVETLVRGQAERVLNDLDVVQREEFDAVRDMAAKARTENQALEKRIAVLEATLADKAAVKPKAAAKRPAAKAKTTAKATARGAKPRK